MRYRSGRGYFVSRAGLAVALVLLSLSAAAAHGASIDVQGVAASGPGKPPVIPKDLDRFKSILRNFQYGSFSSAGGKAVSIPAGGKSTVTIGRYGVQVSVRGSSGAKTKIDVSISDNGRAIADKPMSYDVSAGESVPIQVGPNSAPTIVIITVRGD